MSNNNSVVLLDKNKKNDRFLGIEGKVEVSKILKDMLKDEIFSKIQDIQPEQMLSILMAFFTFDLLSRQYGIIFNNDFDNNYLYSTVFAEITSDLIGITNFVYIQKNRAIISNLFGINPDTLGNSTYEIIIDPQGEIIIVKTIFYFLFGTFKNSEKILLAMIQNTITYYLSSNHKLIEDKFRWILCQSDYNFIKNQCGDSEKPWFMDCLSIDQDLKPVTKVEETQHKIVVKNKQIAEMEKLIASTASTTEDPSSTLSAREIEEQTQQNERNKIKLQRMQSELQNEDQEHQEALRIEAEGEEAAKIGMGSRVWSTVKQNPIKTLLGIGGLTAAGTFIGLAVTGGKHTKKPRRKLKKRATQRKPKIVTKNNTKKRKKIKRRRQVKTIKKR